jgi:metal-responsive CopG/Arc/MetJ family transcriptional regulator
MTKQIMTSVKLQKALHLKMQQQIITDGYGMRGKSKWIIEAIEYLLQLKNYPSLVDIAVDMDQLHESLSIRFPETLMQKLDSAIIHVRCQFPGMEGVKSNLIRASIMQRLIRTSHTP